MKQSDKPKSFNWGDLPGYSHDSESSESEAENDSLTDLSEHGYLLDLPHFKKINQLAVIDVARKIEWEVAVVQGDKDSIEKIVCPRSVEHKPGTSQYLKVLPSNNKVVCVSCDTYPMTVLDMVRNFEKFETLRDAAEHVANYFPDLPRKPKASYLSNPTGESVPPDCRNPWVLLISSGIWAELSVPSQRLIPVLLTHSKWKDDGQTYRLKLSQRAMMRYSGVGSFTGINEALTELAAIGFLERVPVPRRKSSVERETAEYVLTPLSQRLRELADAAVANFGEAIFQSKAIRRREKQARERKRMFPNLDIHKM
ncbi:MAG TPA: hypothetical protein VJW94_03515 [Candidatus Acidoferrum sp.]|nr:hypothetical protein [Candidatus Acidoferrum sp.]